MPGQRAICSECEQTVIAKCGDIKIWHWAHETLTDCALWHENETAWHLGWKQMIQSEFCEVPYPKHRADIVGDGGVIIELQHSYISPKTIAEREDYYKNMVWVFNAETFKNNFLLFPKEYGHSFKWLWGRPTFAYVKKPLIIDLGSEMFIIKKLYVENRPFRGWGRIISKNDFIASFLSSVIKPECLPPKQLSLNELFWSGPAVTTN